MQFEFMDILQNGATVTRRRNSYFCFLCIQKVFSSLHIEPLMADGLFWRCLYDFSGPWQCYLLNSQWDVTSPPVFIQNTLNCVPKTNNAFTGLERHGGKWFMTTLFILGWSNSLILCKTKISLFFRFLWIVIYLKYKSKHKYLCCKFWSI